VASRMERQLRATVEYRVFTFQDLLEVRGNVSQVPSRLRTK